MTLITHRFISAIADDPASVTAGEVVPSNWNDDHDVSGFLAHGNTWTAQQVFNTIAPQIGTATASTIAGFDASKNLVTLSTATYPSLTELSYVKGVTSAIQTQLNTKGTGTIGGSIAATQVAFGSGANAITGDANFTYSSGAITLSSAGGSSTAINYLTGALYTGGTGTTSFPHILHQPTGTTAATTWSSGANNGTVFGANEAGGFTGNYADFRIAGAKVASIDSAGQYNLYGSGFGTMSFGLYGSASYFGFRDSNMLFISGNGRIFAQGTSFNVSGDNTADDTAKLGFAPNWYTSPDTYFTRISDGIFQAGTAASPQAIRMGNARFGYDASNYLDVTLGSTGAVTFDAVGSGAGFTFEDNLTLDRTSTSGASYNPSRDLVFVGNQQGTPLTWTVRQRTPTSNAQFLDFIDTAGSTQLSINYGTGITARFLAVGNPTGTDQLQFLQDGSNDWYQVINGYNRNMYWSGQTSTYALYCASNTTSKIGINTNSTNARLNILDTTEQVRTLYDASNYFSTTVGTTGGVTFDAVGAGAGFTFSDQITGSAGYVGSDLTASKPVFTDSGKKLTSTGVVPVANGGTGVTSFTPTLCLFDHFADANNSGTSETDLYSDTIPAGQLATTGDKLFGDYGGVFSGAVSATQQLRAYFGGTLIFDSGALAIGVATPSWDIYVTVIRVSASVVRCVASITTSSAALSSSAQYTEVTGLTLANTQVLKITGTAGGVAGASSQITAKLSTVSYAGHA